MPTDSIKNWNPFPPEVLDPSGTIIPQPVAPTPEVLPAPIPEAPVQPTMQPTGQVTTTSRKELPADYNKAIQQMDEAAALNEKAFQLSSSAIQQQSQLDAQAAQEKYKIATQIEAEEKQRLASIDMEMKKAGDEYQAAVARYTNEKPESFWGSKSTGEKIGMSIALALGAFGSAKTGGPNMALSILNQQMQDFHKTQDAAMTNKLNLLNTRKGNLMDLQKARQQIFLETQAKKTAAWDKVALKTESMMGVAKSQTQLAKLQSIHAAAQQESAKLKAQTAEMASANITTQVSGRLTSTNSQTSSGFSSQDDTGGKLSGEQLKKLGFLERSMPALQRAEEFEQNLSNQEYKNLQNAISAIELLESAEDVPFLGKGTSIIRRAGTGLTTEEILLKSGVPGALEYYQDLLEARDALLRDESGAALSGEELKRKKQALFPSKVTNRTNMKAIQVRRRENLSGLRTAVGQQSVPFWWEKDKK